MKFKNPSTRVILMMTLGSIVDKMHHEAALHPDQQSEEYAAIREAADYLWAARKAVWEFTEEPDPPAKLRLV